MDSDASMRLNGKLTTQVTNLWSYLTLRGLLRVNYVAAHFFDSVKFKLHSSKCFYYIKIFIFLYDSDPHRK